MRHGAGLAAIALVIFGSSPAAAHGAAAESTSTFTVDPLATIVIVALALAYAIGARRVNRATGGSASRTAQVGFYTGCGLFLVALASSLTNASDALLSAHMVQHLVLVTLAPILVVVGRPDLVLFAAMPREWFPVARRFARAAMSRPILAAMVHGLSVWAWHTPPLFEAALVDPPLHVLEHASFVLTAVWFWSALLASARSPSHRLGAGVAALATLIHSGILGAVLTFAPRHIYTVYRDDALTLGLDPLSDQQLAGLVMWVPGGVIYLAAALWVVGRILAVPRHREWSRAPAE